MNSFLMTPDNGQLVYDRIKTQTRRPIKDSALLLIIDLAGDTNDPSPLTFEWVTNCQRQDDNGTPYRYTGLLVSLEEYPDEGALEVPCPFRVGEIRYIREAHYLYGRWIRSKATKSQKPRYHFIADRSKGACYPNNPPPHVCTNRHKVGWFRRSGLFMPQWAARSFVRILSVWGEQIQSISEEDAIAEGIPYTGDRIQDGMKVNGAISVQGHFHILWDSIYGPDAWKQNWWVWGMKIERVTVN